MTKFFVSRQCQWPTGDNIVEIAAGGIDHSGPNMLCDNFKSLGEGEEFTDPREALKAAFAIRKAWHGQLRFYARADPGIISDEVRIEAGHNVDMFIMSEEPTDKELHVWAEKEWEAAPKCDECGEVIEDEAWRLFEDGDLLFCSEYCADKCYAGYFDSEENYVERYG